MAESQTSEAPVGNKSFEQVYNEAETPILRNAEALLFYMEDSVKRTKNGLRNRAIGKLSVGTEDGKADILDVGTKKRHNREFGLSLAERIVDKVRGVDNVEDGADEDSLTGSREVEGGLKQYVTVTVDRSSERSLPTHGDQKDSMGLRVWTVGEDGEGDPVGHTVEYRIGLSGDVSMRLGEEGKFTPVNYNSDAGDKFTAEVNNLPDLSYPPELPY